MVRSLILCTSVVLPVRYFLLRCNYVLVLFVPRLPFLARPFYASGRRFWWPVPVSKLPWKLETGHGGRPWPLQSLGPGVRLRWSSHFSLFSQFSIPTSYNTSICSALRLPRGVVVSAPALFFISALRSARDPKVLDK